MTAPLFEDEDEEWGDDEFSGAAAAGPQYPDAPTVVLVLNNGARLDISGDVRFSAGIKTRRGRAATDTKARAGDARMQINNRDGKYSPRNPTSVLYGLIGRNTQLFVTRRNSIRFWGEIPEWPSEWTTGGQDAWVNLVASGPLRRLLAPNAPVLESAMRRAFVYGATPVAYWPVEGGDSTTTVVYDLISNAPSAVGGFTGLAGAAGATAFGRGDLGPGSKPVADISGGFNLDLNIPETTPATGTVVLQFSLGFGKTVRTGTFSKCGIRLNPHVNAKHLGWNVFCYDDGHVELSVFEADNALNLTGGPTVILSAGAENWFDGKPRQFQLTLTASGGTDVAWILLENDVSKGAGTFTPTFAGAMNSAPWRIAAYSGADAGSGMAFGHAGAFTDPNVSDKYDALLGHTGEAAGTRMARLCLENGVSIVIEGDPADTMPMGPQGVDKLIDLIYDCEQADDGFLGEARDRFALTYRTLTSMIDTNPTLWLNYAASGNLVLPLKSADNDQRIVNDVDVHLTDGSSHYRYTLSSGPMSTAAIASGGIGTYPESPTINVQTIPNASDVAGWRVNVGTTDLQRFDQVNVNVSNTAVNHGLQGLADQMVNADIGDRIAIDNPPVWTTVDQLNFIMVGESESFDQYRYTIAYDTVLQAPYQVGVLDDPALGHLESDGTTVQAGISSVATTFKGLAASGELWATTALLPADFSFDIMVAGERMTVTGIVGVANPQDWTVTRSVNGVVKSIPAGSAIYVRNPFRLGQ